MAACGSGGSGTGNSAPSPRALVRDARSAFDSASSVKISGVVAYNGKNLTVNVGMFRSGDVSGTVSIDGTSVPLTIVNGKAYEYVSKKLFRAISQTQRIPAAACAVICGKYVEGSIGVLRTFNLASLTRLVNSKMPRAGGTVKVTSFRGQPAYELSAPEGSQGFIAEQGKHYLLGIHMPRQGTLTFSEWNSVPPVKPPPASKIAHLSGLG